MDYRRLYSPATIVVMKNSCAEILKFLFLFCMPSEYPILTLECPPGVHLIKPYNINRVYTDREIFKKRLHEKDQKIKELEQKLGV